MPIEHIFNNVAYGRIKGGISASATTIELYPGHILSFLPGWVSGKEFYLTITDSSANVEIVKVTALNSETNDLTVERGQDGLSARQWYDGSVICQRLVAANCERLIQKESFREVAYNPNGVLSASYLGEKVYQSGPTDCEKRWWKNTTGTKWRLIAGGICGDEYYDDDGYIYASLEFTHIDNDYQHSIAKDVWADGLFAFLASSGAGLDSYSVDEAGLLTYLDTSDPGGTANGVWGDGNFVFLAAGSSGVHSYSVDEAGNLTHIDADDRGGSANGVWGDGNFVYVANESRGLESYSVDGAGNLTHIDNVNIGVNPFAVWGDGNLVFTANFSGTITSYSVDGAGNLTLLDGYDFEGTTQCYGIWGDGSFIYVASVNRGVDVLSVNAEGEFTPLNNVSLPNDVYSIWGDGDYIYAACGPDGVYVYTVDESGNLSLEANDDQGESAQGVWGDGTFIYFANYLRGIESYGWL